LRLSNQAVKLPKVDGERKEWIFLIEADFWKTIEEQIIMGNILVKYACYFLIRVE